MRRGRAARASNLVLAALVVWIVGAPAATAQDDDATATPAFAVSSWRVFEPGGADPPTVQLTFQRLDHVDFRIYRVRDARAFFTGLRELHAFGSPAHRVAEEPTPIERLARWKAGWRARVRDFFRQQVSPDYRRARRAETARQQVARRQVIGYTQFAQVPLLNPDQLVASWRELLPNTRGLDARSIPLELPDVGVYLVEAVHAHLRAYTIVIVSRLGLVTKTAPGEMLMFGVDRRTGDPRAGCAASVIVNQAVVGDGTTGGDGLFLARLPRADADGLVALLACEGDTVVSDPGAYFLQEPARTLKGYVYTDRPIYRPGHTVHLKAILRWLEGGLPRRFDRSQVEVVVTDPDGKVILRQPRPVDRFGAAFTSLALPATAALGTYAITVNAGEAQATGSFAVEEYRKPEFEVAVSTPVRHVLQGTAATVRIRARYYFGQPVAHGRVTYVTYTSWYWSPWRDFATTDEAPGDLPAWYGDQHSQAEAVLDANGEATVTVPMPTEEQGGELAVRIEARVRDATGREVSGRTGLIATAGPFVVATEANRWVVPPGGPIRFRVRVVDHDGRPQRGLRVAATLERSAWSDGTSTRTRVAGTTLTTDEQGLAVWQVTAPAEPGSYVMRAQVGADGRTMSSETSIWVPGADSTDLDDVDRSIELIADRATYAPGETAKLLVRGVDHRQAMLVTKEHARTSWHGVADLDPGETIEVPITGDDVGDVWVNVAFVRDDRLFVAERRLKVPPVDRGLRVTVAAAQAVSRPREPGLFTLRVVDAAGQPVQAQVSLGVVDEAVYGVRPDTTPDPVAFFYRRNYSSVATGYSRIFSFTGYSGVEPLQLAARRRRPLTLADFKAERPERVPVRKEFPDAIFWVADLVTDATGSATVRVAYPDSLTTWRVTARAVTEDTRLGATVARTTTTRDVIVRVAAPRFLTEGDTVEVPLIAHNYLDTAQRFDVSLGATGLDPEGEDAGGTQPVEIASRGEHRSLWRFSAPRPGQAIFTGSARTDVDGDTVQVTLPVLPFGLARQAGTSGALGGTGEQAVTLEVPDTANPASRRVEITLAPTLAGSMLAALDFLVTYPYGCTEQTVSGFLPNLLVMRALASLQLAPTERVALAERHARAGLARLVDLQHEDGGFGWWKTDQSEPFMTAYALHGLLEAREAGLRVDDWRIARAAGATAAFYRRHPRMLPDLKAWLAYTLSRAAARGVEIPGDEGAWNDGPVRDELWTLRDRMGPQGRALLLMTLDAAADPRAATLAGEIMAGARSRGELAWWPSDTDPLLDDASDTSVEATALTVQALARHEAAHPLLERAVRWLLASRGSGASWPTTKQAALTLDGLLAYLDARNERPAAFDVAVFLNGEQVATRAFTPETFATPDPVRLSLPARPGRNDVRLVKRGAGTLYWSAAAHYHDVREAYSREGSRTLAVSRQYFSLVPVEVRGRMVYREQPFTGTARPGDVLLVRLTVAGASDWRYLVIEDPLPAGTEAVTDPEAWPLERSAPWWTFGRERREYRDQRVVQFQDRLPRGRAEFAWLLKVVTPGRFRALPAQVSPMYVPGVSAATSVTSVTVLDGANNGRADGTGENQR